MLLWWVLGAVAGQNCATYQCQDLNQEVCAKLEAGQVLLNSLGCRAGLNCSLSDLLQWHADQSSPSFYCEAIEESALVQHTTGLYGYHCGERKPRRNLATGGHPKQCSSEQDCRLEDESLSPCGCSFGSERFCVPQWDSIVFDDYWTYCQQEDGRIYDFAEIYYWIIVKETYTYQQNPPLCVLNLFTEFLDLARLASISVFSLYLLLPFELFLAI